MVYQHKGLRYLNALYQGGQAGYKVGKFIKNAYRSVKSVTTTKKRSSTGNDRGLTTQHDVVSQYRRKRMPRRKRNRWRKFVRKVQAIDESAKHVRSIVFNSAATDATNDNAHQVWVAVHLYGGSGNNEGSINREQGTRDLLRICGQDPEIYTNGGAAKVHMVSAALDCTMQNTGDSNLEVDVYKIIYGYNEKDMNCFATCVAAGDEFTNALNATKATIVRRGVTPFDLGGLISSGKIRILSKRKYLISVGQCATFQHRDPKNRWVSCQDLVDGGTFDPVVNDFTYKKFTQTYLFIAKPTTQIGPELATASLTVRATRSYHYKIEDRKQNLFSNEYVSY